MSWASAVSDLRTQLSDGPLDKLRYRKRCFDQANGVNKVFKTFEFRRLTNFTTATAPEGVYVDGVAVTLTSDMPSVGEFTLTTAPLDGQIVECTYYTQWFLDAELLVFLSMSANWIGQSGNYDSTPEGLKPCLLKYACADAYQKLALRWAEHISETYRLEDGQDPKRMEIVNSYRQAGLDARKEAEKMRDSFYTRQGRNLQPLFASMPGKLADPMPKR
jgi:hypothetical protein